MSGVNKVFLIGNLGQDPKTTQFDSGKTKTELRLATSQNYMKDGERMTQTEWHNVVLWGPQAEVAQKFLQKGRQVCIEGRLTTRSYEDANGVQKYITEVVARELTLLQNKNSSPSYPQEPEEAKEEHEDLPF